MQHNPAPEKKSWLALAIINKQNADAIKLINADVADINAKNSNHETPLFLAAATGNYEVAQTLLQKPQIKINVVSASGWNALETAALRGDADIVQLLMANGAFVQNETLFDELLKRDLKNISDLINNNLNRRLRLFEIPEHEINDTDKLILKKLSLKNIKRLQKIVTNLNQQGKLTSDTFSDFLAKVARKNPVSVPSQMTADKAKPGFFIVDGMTFRIFPKPLFQGGEGVIYGGYVDAAPPATPDYCIKKYVGPDAAAAALHELKYLQSIGRRAAAVKAGNVISLVTEWQRGENLESLIEKNEISAASIPDRIKWIASGLADLEKVHAAFRIHGDIKTLNLVLDKETGVMKCIDLGAAQKINSPKNMKTTLHFIDLKEGYPKKPASDMYGMGKVIARMFPELYSYPMKKFAIGIANPGEQPRMEDVDIMQCEKKKTTDLTPLESAIMHLVDAMMDPNAEHRCTCEQALKFCQLLQEKISANELNERTLTEILNATLNRNTFTVDDALRDSKRPALFAAQARKIGEKDVEPPEAITQPTAVKKAKTKAEKPAAERKTRTKETKSPEKFFQPAPKKKARAKTQSEGQRQKKH